jgi:hypothetical protein
MTKMPLGAKLTQNDSDAIFEIDLNIELIKNLFKPIENTQGQFSEIKRNLNI